MRRVTRALLCAAFVGGIGLLSAGQAAAAAPAAAPASSFVDAAYGFAFADQPSNPSYTPNARMSTNSTGATNTVTRHGVGDYSVRMPGLGATAGGNAQVTAYGNHANRCKTSYWLPSGGAMVVGVVCDTPTGAAVDTPFVAQFWRALSVPHQSAYLQATLPTEPTYVADPVYSYNSKGGPNRITRTGTGAYRVQFGGFTTLGGIIHVTALGFSADYCKVRSWNIAEADVRCFSSGGVIKDSAFSLRYQDRHVANDFVELGGYAWSNQPSPALGIGYTPDARHQFNMQNSTLLSTVTRTAVGRYKVRFPSIPAFDAGSPMVTAHSANNATCKATELFSSGSSSLLEVDCRLPNGTLADSTFTVSQTTNQ